MEGLGWGRRLRVNLLRSWAGGLVSRAKSASEVRFGSNCRLAHAEPRGIDLVDDYAASRKVPTSVHATTNGGVSKPSRIRGVRVLVAEDNATNQRVTRLILESGGHFATIVNNGDEALDALERGGFDIALFDLSMPVVSGLEALKMYRFVAVQANSGSHAFCKRHCGNNGAVPRCRSRGICPKAGARIVSLGCDRSKSCGSRG